MLRNYFKTALRCLYRERYYAILKITGLALGLGTSMVIFIYIAHELSYDEFHPDVERMYRVDQTNIWNPDGGIFGSTGPVIATILAKEYPEVDEVLRINTPGSQMVKYESGNVIKAFYEDKILAADTNFFSFFKFELKEGDPHTALVGKNKVVLSDKAALKIFGEAPAVGKTILVGDKRTAVEVTGVTKEQPSNVHFKFDYLFSLATNPAIEDMEWSFIWTQVVTYVKLKPGIAANSLLPKLSTFADRHAPASFEKLGLNYNEFKKEKGAWEFLLTPVRDIYLYTPDYGNRIGSVSDIKYIYALGAIAIFILLIAIINFINLSTARGINRAKEVGVKKTLGVRRGSLVIQFQVEYIILSYVAMLLGLGFMEILRLILSPIAGISFPLSVWDNGTFILIILVTPFLIGILAGLYPSIYLTSFRPAEVLKGKLVSGLRTAEFRNVLVVFQFTIAIGLMAATLIVFQQLRFFQTQHLGFDQRNLIMINHAEKLGGRLESFRGQVDGYQGVIGASIGMDMRNSLEDIFMREGDHMKLPITQYKIDEHFFHTTKLSLASGRSFEKDRISDENAIIINETTAQLYGWSPEQALGKIILYLGDDVGKLEVIGVVKDFHFQSLRQSISPLMFLNINSKMWGDGRMVMIRYDTKDLPSLLKHIEKTWTGLSDGAPFEFTFYDEALKNQYFAEQRLGRLFSVFTGLSITIAIIGLLGLVAYSAEQRKKEIGIRKVFGASRTNVFVLINSQYVKLIALALVIATPLVWWLMDQWLNTFPYHTNIDPLIFITAGMIELLLALGCVGFLAIRAASLNPAVVLKEE